jgi:hypothetical protein
MGMGELFEVLVGLSILFQAFLGYLMWGDD